jgi:hypothetical protein
MRAEGNIHTLKYSMSFFHIINGILGKIEAIKII